MSKTLIFGNFLLTRHLPATVPYSFFWIIRLLIFRVPAIFALSSDLSLVFLFLLFVVFPLFSCIIDV